MKTNLTQAFVKRIQCEAGKSKQEFYDIEIQGFILEVSASGAKSYYVRTSVDGKRVAKNPNNSIRFKIESPKWL